MPLFPVDELNFEEEVNQHKGVVVVHFWAEWSAPSKALTQVLNEIAQEIDGKAKITQLNIDTSPDTTVDYEVRAVPTVILFKNGEIVDTAVGGMPKEEMKARIVKQLG